METAAQNRAEDGENSSVAYFPPGVTRDKKSNSTAMCVSMSYEVSTYIRQLNSINGILNG